MIAGLFAAGFLVSALELGLATGDRTQPLGLDAAQKREVLSRFLEADRKWDSLLSARIAFSVETDLSQLTEPIHASIRFNERYCTGRAIWEKDGRNERIELDYDLPRHINPGSYVDRAFIANESELVELFPNSRQAILYNRTAIPTFPVPEDWVRPLDRGSAIDRISTYDVAASTNPDGTVTLRFADEAEGADDVDVVLDPVLEYATVHWNRGALNCDLEYRQSDRGPILACATLQVAGTTPASNPQRTYTFVIEEITFDCEIPETRFDPRGLPPGTVVTDAREPQDEEARAWIVGPDGRWNKATVVQPNEALTTGQLGSIAAGSILVVSVAGLLRARFSAPNEDHGAATSP